MSTRCQGAMGECEARTQGARVLGKDGATEDTASRRPARPGGPCFIALGAPSRLFPHMAHIAFFGAGYAGLVSGVCLAELGHNVVIRDVVPERVEALKAGRVPFYEPGLEELIARNAERLSFTLSMDEAVGGSEFLFVCVGTPPTYSGDADLSAVWTVIEDLPASIDRVVLVMKSTVPVGTGEKVRSALDARGLTRVGYVSCPEFLAEGTAVRDFMEADRVVIGSFDDTDGDAVQ